MEQLGTIVSKIPNECLISSQGGRSENQDSCETVDTKFGRLLIVCDGMGGGPSGKLASTLAVDAIIRNVNSLSETETDLSLVVEEAIKAANQALRDNVKENRANSGMGTTAVVALVSKYCVTVGHVGDSRFYQLRGTGKRCMVFRTTDHSLVMQMVKETGITEEEARLTTPSNIITRALGTQDEVEVEINELHYKSGDRFVLCSDGIWGAMPESDLLEMLTQAPSLMGTVDSVSIKVEECGMQKGGRHDNHTIIIYETQANSVLKETKVEDSSLTYKEINENEEGRKSFKISPKNLSAILTAIICCVIGWTLFHHGDTKTKQIKTVDSTKVATRPINKTTTAQPVVPSTIDTVVESKILKEIEAAERKKCSNKDDVKKQVVSETDSKKSDSIKSKPKSKSGKYDKRIVNTIDEIIIHIKSIQTMKDPKNKDHIVKAMRLLIDKLKGRSNNYKTEIEAIHKKMIELKHIIDDSDYNIHNKEVLEGTKRPRSLPSNKAFENRVNGVVADLENLKSAVKNNEFKNK